MLVGAGWAWTEISKTLGSLGFGSGGFDLNLDFSNFNFPAVDNKVEQARKELEGSIAAAQGADPMAEVQGSTTLGVANTGSARNPDGTPANPGANTPSSTLPIAEVPIETAEGVGTQEVTEIGDVDYGGPQPAGPLAEVDDPDKAFADVAKDRYDFIRTAIRPFQEGLVDQLEDDSLIRQAPADALTQTRIAEDISTRNLSRYGVRETAAARRQRGMGQQFVRTVAVTDAINNARIGQLDKNQALLNTLVNAASAINRTSMGQLGTAAGLQQQREAAYSNARSAARQNKYGIIGSLIGSI